MASFIEIKNKIFYLYKRLHVTDLANNILILSALSYVPIVHLNFNAYNSHLIHRIIIKLYIFYAGNEFIMNAA